MGIAIAEILGCIKLKRKQLILDIKGYCRVFTASGNQPNEGKLEGIFPVREKSGNLAFQSEKSQGIWLSSQGKVREFGFPVREKSGNLAFF